MSRYVQSVYEDLKNRVPWETEFLQAVAEVFECVSPVIEREPLYQKQKILERVIEPERTIAFRVPWVDDQGEIQVNRGWRVEFNSAIGPYKGGIRFHASVNLSILKFLGFEQIFKNALTGLPMGGGKGGSDFSPRGKSDAEIMRFCQAFMSELFRHISADNDVPAGDIGVGGREIGYMFGQYKKLKNRFEGVLTGKGTNWGGSLIRPEATGFGVTYFAQEMLKTKGTDFQGKTVAVSGFGNVAWGACQKVTELGGKVLTISGPDGFIIDKDGVGTAEKWDYMVRMRNSGKDQVKDYADKFKCEFYPGKRPWGAKVDLALPCAIQNELDIDDAKQLIGNNCIAIVEGANMPTTAKALETIQASKTLFSPGKASNAGGVACSGLEMSQNSMRLSWTAEEVDNKLKAIMVNIHNNCMNTAKEFNKGQDYVFGANVAGFKKIADSMIDQGIV